MVKVNEIEFKGKPILEIKVDGWYPLRLGLRKAKYILENIEAIKEFVKKHEIQG